MTGHGIICARCKRSVVVPVWIWKLCPSCYRASKVDASVKGPKPRPVPAHEERKWERMKREIEP